MAELRSASQYMAYPRLFLDFVATKLEWGSRSLAGDILIDVGCGNVADLLVERFPDLQRVICIDKRKNLIKYMECKNRNRLIEYRCLNIEKWSDVGRFDGVADKVLSAHNWHMLKDQGKAFGNVLFILRPGGEAAFLFCIWTGYADWFRDLTQNSRWNRYFNGRTPLVPVTQFLPNLDEEYYTIFLTALGFQVVYCVKDTISTPFPSDQQCKEDLLRLISSPFPVPSELKDEFQSYIFETFMKYNGRDEERRPCQTSYYVTIIVKKPLRK